MTGPEHADRSDGEWRRVLRGQAAVSPEQPESFRRRQIALLLASVMIALTGAALAINVFEGNAHLYGMLASVIAGGCTMLLWLRLRPDAATGPLHLGLAILALLGIRLILSDGIPDGSSLFWILLFPFMLTFCLGSFHGAVAFWLYEILLGCLLVGAPHLLATPMPASIRTRFLVAMAGAFVFSWGMERIRAQSERSRVGLPAKRAETGVPGAVFTAPDDSASAEEPAVARMERTHHRRAGIVLGVVMTTLTSGALAINVAEGNHHLYGILIMVIACGGIMLLWLRLRRDAALGPLYLGIGVLLLLGARLLLSGGASEGGSLFWFLILPPMLIFCFGLVRGGIVFWCYEIFLILLLVGPLQPLMAAPLPQPVKWRFLAAMAGGFIFCWGMELARIHALRRLTQAMARLEHNSRTDLLTGLGNRRAFDLHIRSLPPKGTLDGGFAVAVADIDFFKKVNDTWGHQVGDAVLRHVAFLLSRTCRPQDGVYRWGGEEFLIFMPAADEREGLALMTRARLVVEARPWTDEERGLSVPVTISCGIAAGSRCDRIDACIAGADAALYAAKAGGRNRVEIGGTPDAPAPAAESAERAPASPGGGDMAQTGTTEAK